MDVQVNHVDIRELQLPANVKAVNVLLSCALAVYIVSTLWRLSRQHSASLPPKPLLYGDTEL